MLDKDGNRIDRRNAQDIVVPLYNNQIPPGAGQAVHYGISIPEDITAPVRVDVKLKYRKFDAKYMEFITETARDGDKPIRGHNRGEKYVNDLPIMLLAEDSVVFPLAGVEETVENPPRDVPAWQRWNDYGIGLFLEGKAELRQAADAFAEVEKLGRYDGPLNLARVLHREGRLDEAVAAIERAARFDDPSAPPWTMGWLSGLINREQGYLEAAADNFRSVLETKIPSRKFDFSLDYDVINLLGLTLFDLANQEIGSERKEAREALFQEAVEQFERTLEVDSENVTAHYNLHLLYARLGEQAKADEHQRLHARYKRDDNAADRASSLAREKYPAANHAAEALVIYPLQRSGAPELPLVRANHEDLRSVEKGGAE